mmetsp:Transcript_38453/g.78797  ORF Transcript_38453/g.78797 Transcript_38453/m.78797 type:complete len:252 (+) Transcript_38453:1525-2280(+)
MSLRVMTSPYQLEKSSSFFAESPSSVSFCTSFPSPPSPPPFSFFAAPPPPAGLGPLAPCLGGVAAAGSAPTSEKSRIFAGWPTASRNLTRSAPEMEVLLSLCSGWNQSTGSSTSFLSSANVHLFSESLRAANGVTDPLTTLRMENRKSSTAKRHSGAASFLLMTFMSILEAVWVAKQKNSPFLLLRNMFLHRPLAGSIPHSAATLSTSSAVKHCLWLLVSYLIPSSSSFLNSASCRAGMPARTSSAMLLVP